jgi:hypothetical protein
LVFDPKEVDARWPGIPELVLRGMARYFNDHVPVGGFLTACLENRLVEAFERADPWSLEALPQIVRALANDGPTEAWGSPMKVARWIEAGQVLRAAGKLA